ncbi:MAG: methionyl-tRNA formyltransferase [Bdellovibrionota bacterium]
MSGKPTLVYFGTPDLAVPPLQALVESGAYEVLGVVTQTDKPAGRGNKLTPSPVKEFAVSRGIPVFQPVSLKSIAKSGSDTSLQGTKSNLPLVELLNAHTPIDLFVVVAYGKIIPDALLDFPRHGIVNIHMSLLPKLRGAAPIQRAVLNGDRESGVSLMRIDAGVDTGPVYATEVVPIDDEDTSGTLTDKLVQSGVKLLLGSLPHIIEGSLQPRPQSTEGSTYAEKLEKNDFRLVWSEPSTKAELRVRAGNPRPGAFAQLNDQPMKVFRARSCPDQNFPTSQPGMVVEANAEELIVSCGHGTFLKIEELQLPGKKRLSAAEVVRGRGIRKGDRLT